MQGLGKHVLVEFFRCDLNVLNDKEALEAAMHEAARVANATIYESVFHGFSPHGISGVVVVGESHLAIHTWPENGFAAVDLFTCSDNMQPQPAIDYLTSVLNSERVEVKEVVRGERDKL